jgi:hypothetical protein
MSDKIDFLLRVLQDLQNNSNCEFKIDKFNRKFGIVEDYFNFS